MNKCIFLGNLVSDPDTKTTQSGKTVTRFRVAVKRDMKNQDGKYDSDYISCIAFGKTGETIARYFEKGRKILLETRCLTGSYDKKDGTKVYTTDFVVDSFHFVDSPVKATESRAEATDIKTQECGFVARTPAFCASYAMQKLPF